MKVGERTYVNGEWMRVVWSLEAWSRQTEKYRPTDQRVSPQGTAERGQKKQELQTGTR